MADDKVLGIVYRAQGAQQVAASTRTVQSAIGGLHTKTVAFASSLKTNLGGALTHFGGRLREAATGIAAFAGIGGLLGFTGALEQSLAKAQAWGLQIEKLQGITHDSAESLSGLLAVTEKYGLSDERLAQIAGFTEKALGNLTKGVDDQGHAVKGAADFVKNYGFNIYDTSGRVKDFSSLLLTFADYWKNGAETPAVKAAAAAKLFGRGYADLVPVLNLGAKGIQDAEEEAKKLGLTLTQDNVVALAKAREATRQWGDAIGGLELQIGLALLPTLTDLARAATKFISDHRTDIVTFFKNAVAAGRHVVSVVSSLATKVSAFWNSIPQGLRDLLLKGLIADRTVNFLFGVSPAKLGIDIGKNAIEGLIGGIGRAVGTSLAAAGLGKLFVQPVFVTNPGFGGPGLPGALGTAAEGAAAGEVAAAAGGVSLGTAAAVLATPLAIALAPYLVAALLPRNEANFLRPNDPTFNATVASRPAFGSTAPALAPTSGSTFHDSAETRALQTTAQALIDQRASERSDWVASIEATRALTGVMRHAPWLQKLEDSWRKAGQTMHDRIKAAIAGLTGPHAGTAAAFLGTHLGQAGFGAGGLKQAEAVITALKALHSGDPAVARAIARLTAQLPRLKTDAADLAKAEEIAQSSDPKNKKLDELNAVMTDLKNHGDKTTQRKVSDLIAAVKHNKVNITVKNTATTTVRITVGGINKTQTTYRQYQSGGALRFAL